MGNSFIEDFAQKLGIIPNLDREEASGSSGALRTFPKPEDWHDHAELDANEWPKRVERRYSLIPTTCFNLSLIHI